MYIKLYMLQILSVRTTSLNMSMGSVCLRPIRGELWCSLLNDGVFVGEPVAPTLLSCDGGPAIGEQLAAGGVVVFPALETSTLPKACPGEAFAAFHYFGVCGLYHAGTKLVPSCTGHTLQREGACAGCMGMGGIRHGPRAEWDAQGAFEPCASFPIVPSSSHERIGQQAPAWTLGSSACCCLIVPLH